MQERHGMAVFKFPQTEEINPRIDFAAKEFSSGIRNKT